MAIFQSPEIIANKPASQGHEVGSVFAFCNSITIAINPVAADTYEFGKVPAGATVIGGWLMAPDLDTNATETLDMDIGWKATADEAADPDGFGNLGVLVGDALVEYKPVAGIMILVLVPMKGLNIFAFKDSRKNFVSHCWTVKPVAAAVSAI